MRFRPSSIDPITGEVFAAEDFRPFGNHGFRQSRTCLIDVPLLLVVTGLLTWLVPGNGMFVIGAAVGALAGIFLLVDIIIRAAPLRFSSMLAMTMLLAYNLGALNSWLTIPRAGLTIAEYFARDPADLARAAGTSMLACALMLVVGELYEKPLFGEEFRLKMDSRAELLVIISTVLIAIAYYTGQLGYMGIAVDPNGHITPFAALILWWAAPAFGFSLCVTLNTKGMRVVLAICTLIQMLALVPTGRRFFAYAVLGALIAIRLGEFRVRLALWKKLAIAGLGVALISFASIAFLYLRVAGWGHREATSMSTRLRLAYDTMHTRGFSDISRLMTENASTRTFLIGYFSDLLGASLRSSPMLGEDALHYMKLMIPSSISPSKLDLEPYEEEQLVNMHWGFGYTDEPNSIFTAGAADFGFFGVLLYPLLLVLLYRVFLELIQTVLPTFAAVMIALALINQVLLPEQTLIGYFIELRNSLIFVGILYLFFSLPKFRMRSPQQDW